MLNLYILYSEHRLILESRQLELLYLAKIAGGTEISGCFQITGLEGYPIFKLKWKHFKRHVFVLQIALYIKLSKQVSYHIFDKGTALLL